jgi:hypothetical protein
MLGEESKRDPTREWIGLAVQVDYGAESSRRSRAGPA